MYQLKATKASYRTLVALYAEPPEELAKLDFLADKVQKNCELRWQVDKYRHVARLRYLDALAVWCPACLKRTRAAAGSKSLATSTAPAFWICESWSCWKSVKTYIGRSARMRNFNNWYPPGDRENIIILEQSPRAVKERRRQREEARARLCIRACTWVLAVAAFALLARW